MKKLLLLLSLATIVPVATLNASAEKVMFFTGLGLSVGVGAYRGCTQRFTGSKYETAGAVVAILSLFVVDAAKQELQDWYGKGPLVSSAHNAMDNVSILASACAAGFFAGATAHGIQDGAVRAHQWAGEKFKGKETITIPEHV